MKKQTGVWVDAQVWDVYRELCDREKLGLAEPIDGYLRLVVKNGSPLKVLSMIQTLSETRSGRFEDYARVLLNWYKNGQYWSPVTEENNVSVEHLLLNALNDVADVQLRKKISDALMCESRKLQEEMSKEIEWVESPEVEESFSPPEQVPTTLERIENIKKQLAVRKISSEQARLMLEKIHEIRVKLREEAKDRHRK